VSFDGGEGVQKCPARKQKKTAATTVKGCWGGGGGLEIRKGLGGQRVDKTSEREGKKKKPARNRRNFNGTGNGGSRCVEEGNRTRWV